MFTPPQAKKFFTVFRNSMRIGLINNYPNNYYSPSFGVNLQSSKLKFKEDDFYVRIKGYGHHSGWAKKIRETADNAVDYIRRICNFEETIRQVTNGVISANKLISSDAEKQKHTGILRTKRFGWNNKSCWDSSTGLITSYSKNPKNRYRSYADRLDYTVQHPLKNPFRIELTRPVHEKDFGKFLEHGNGKYINTAFDIIDRIYNKLYTNFISEEVKKDSLTDVNTSIAEIRWILAHVTPWERGSDAISNTFIRSLYKAMGIKTYPLKKGVSLDLEAYCTNLEDYKQNFSNYFTKKPKIID